MIVICAGGTKLEWRRHDKADSIAKALFGHVEVADIEIQGSGEARIYILLPCLVRLSTS